MNIKNLSNLKAIRTDKQWSQEQLAELSGLNVRTIQRIEKGEQASVESIKALNNLLNVEFVNDNSEKVIEQAKKEEEYVQKVKGLYKLAAVAVLSLLLPLYQAIMGSSWKTFIWVGVSWVVILIIYSINHFKFFDENWRKKIIEKKFGKKTD